MTEPKRYYGKYRATVLNNEDPMRKGRLTLQVPDVLGVAPSNWAWPCLPAGGRQMGLWALPQVLSGVWAEFEQGDPTKPIWSGSWFGNAGEVPVLANAAPPGLQNIVLQTTGQTALMLSDLPGPTGGILLKSLTGAFISITDVGITLSNGKGASIVLAGTSVAINVTGLVVT